MPLVVNSNNLALFAQRSLRSSQSEQDTAMERLASGLRINSARDDAAGLAITDQMTSQVRGLNQAVRNATDGISAIQTADGAINTLVNDLQRIRELAVQSANDTNSISNRNALQSEAGQLLNNINNIAKTTEFNGVKLFVRGELAPDSDTDRQAVIDGLFGSWFEQSEKLIKDLYGLQGDGAELKIHLQTQPDPKLAASVSGIPDANGKTTEMFLNIDMADFPRGIIPDGGNPPFFSDRIIAHEMVHAVMGRTMNFADGDANPNNNPIEIWFKEGTAEFIHGADERVLTDLNLADNDATNAIVAADYATLAAGLPDDASWTGDSAQYSVAYAAVRLIHKEMKDSGGSGIKEMMVWLKDNADSMVTLDNAFAHFSSAAGGNLLRAGWSNEALFRADFVGATGTNFIQTGLQLANEDTGGIGGFDADEGTAKNSQTVIPDTKYVRLDPLEGFRVSVPNTFGVHNPLLTSNYNLQVGANKGEGIEFAFSLVDSSALGLNELDIANNASGAITQIDKALEYLITEQGKMGAMTNRLQSSINVSSNSSQLQAMSRSRIRDTDFAIESSHLAKSQILQQASLSMIAQANANSQIVLSLLG